MKKIMLLMALTILIVVPIISSAASLGTFAKDQCLELHQVCDNCTNVNLTSMKYPNRTLDNIDSEMTKVNFDYNYTFCSTNSLGRYTYNTCGDLDGIVACENIEFEVTQTGSVLTTSQGIVYLVFFVILILAFLGSIYGAIKIRWCHDRDITDRIIAINDVRYFKIIFWFFSYVLLMFIFGLARAMTYFFLFLQGTAKIFNFLYYTMLVMLFPVVVVALLIMTVNFIGSKKLKKAIMRGVPGR